MPVGEHRLERTNGSGSRSEGDDMYEGAAYRHDERSDTETTFWERDINRLEVSERRKRRLRRMLRRQEGEDPGEAYSKTRRNRKEQNRTEWKRRMVDVFTSRFGLTKYQSERVKHLVMDVLDIDSFGPYSTEQVTLGVINVVARRDGRWIEDEEDFRESVDKENLSMNDMRSLRSLVKDKL